MSAKTAARAAHRAVALWLGIIALVAAVGLLIGSNYASSQVRDQLAQEKITMPVAAAMDGLTQADKDALMPFAGQHRGRHRRRPSASPRPRGAQAGQGHHRLTRSGTTALHVQ